MSEAASQTEIPLFPLNTVLYPGGPLSLRIFETRYLDMVSRCLKEDRGFGVVLIREGAEAGATASTFAVGTMARIVDWNQLEDGLLGVTALGHERFRIEEARRLDDGLNVATVQFLAPEPRTGVDETHVPLAEILQAILSGLESPYTDMDKDYEDASWVGYRLAELLPLPMTEKQVLLELEDAGRRLSLLAPVIRALQERAE
jgi:hypothetical protein